MFAENQVTKTFNVRIQTARDTALNAERENPTLLDGELFILRNVDGISGHEGFKIGDGETTFNQLDYYHDPTKLGVSEKGIANGVATLDENRKVPLSQLPEGYVSADVQMLKTVPSQLGALIFIGEPQTPMFAGYDAATMVIDGVYEATDAGTYIALFSPADGYVWPDGTAYPIEVPWTIDPLPIPAPILSADSFEYDGERHYCLFENYTEAQAATFFTVSGSPSAVNAGRYKLVVETRSNYVIAGDGNDA